MAERRVVAHLAAGGLNARQIADIAAIPRSTIVEWLRQPNGGRRAQDDGLLHSDGCRVLNRVNGKDYPRYFFTQVSDDIRRLFSDTCRRVGVEYTWSNSKTASIARAASVALLDAHVGAKA